MNNNNYVMIPRNFTEWEWYKHTDTTTLFIHLLLKANISDTEYNGIEVKRGCCISTYEELATDTGLTEKQVKTSINRLIGSGDITKQVYKIRGQKSYIFKVNDFERFQNEEETEKRVYSGDPKGYTDF